MSVLQYTNEFGERIIVLSEERGEERPRHTPSESPSHTSAGILQLVANTNFEIDDENDYSTVSENIPIPLNQPLAEGLKTFSVDMNATINGHTDATKFRYITVEYTGVQTDEQLKEMFLNWFIYCHSVGPITFQEMSMYRRLPDFTNIFPAANGNGGVIVYNLFPEMVSPNGLLKTMFAFLGSTPVCFNFKEIPGVVIGNVTLTATYKYLTQVVRSREAEMYSTHGTVSPKWQYLSTNAVTVPVSTGPTSNRTTSHTLDATGNVHGMFIKVEHDNEIYNRVISIKIVLNHQTFLNHSNIIDFRMNTKTFNDSDWMFVPFDFERTYTTLADCFVADHHGGLELGRIDNIRVEMTYQRNVKNVSYAFPAYMSLYRGVRATELSARSPLPMFARIDFFGYDVHRLEFNVPNTRTRTPKKSLCDILSDISSAEPLATSEDCVISHEPIPNSALYAMCIPCSKPMLMDCVIRWLNMSNADNKCPHCRTEWKEFDRHISVYKQVKD